MDIRDYQNQIASLKQGLEIETGNLESEIEVLESEKSSVDEEIKGLELKRDNAQNIQIRRLPAASIDPVRPKIMLYVLMSMTLGLCLSVFLAFFLEALYKRKRGSVQ